MTFKGLKPILYGGREVWPLVEGGKGVAVSNHASSGAWAAAGGIGTVSAVNADFYDDQGNIIEQVYRGLTRRERHDELIEFGIRGAVEQIRRAYDIASGKGAININVLWEMGGAQQVLEGVLERTRGLVTGVTCGAGMPYKLAEIAARFNVNYLPIISSARAFRALWKRAYSKVSELMAAVVYEDPWLAGGHNGLSNAEDPRKPEDPYPRVKALRDTMRAEGIADSVPIVMAGGVWYLRDWEHWIDNPELGQIVFQYGTRPLLTQESPIPQAWKDHLRTLEEGDVLLHRFSPTGFYSSAVRNPFLRNLEERSARQIPYSKVEAGEHTARLDVGVGNKNFWVAPADLEREQKVDKLVAENLSLWQQEGLASDMAIESGYNTDQPIRERGWTHWHHLFNARQIQMLQCILRHGRTTNTWLASLGILNLQSKLCAWHNDGRKGGLQNVFSNQALNTLYNWGSRGLVD
ncbi:MAG TPA: nitronate monooxygenase, partial [Novosphingobium sp.]|nr:nitronate monooxygenase [Novosphingobium sp.]